MIRLAILALGAGLGMAQQRPAQPPPFRSPDVAEDKRVTFRLWAPEARDVQLRGQWMPPRETTKLAKDDAGIWSVTVGPLEPQYWGYSFVVDGFTTIDPRNPAVQQGIRGPGSMVNVPGGAVEYFAWKDVPHGTVHQHWYASKSLHRRRRIHVYTPPGYEKAGKTKYPALYLLHGAGDTDREWVEGGKANLILDNLLAGGKAKPMIIVMPDGWAADPNSTDAAERRKNTELFEADLLGDVIPLAEHLYRVARGGQNRAMAGLSMGGSQTLSIGLRHPGMFGSLGIFSAGIGSGQDARDRFAAQFATALEAPEKLNKQIRLFWIGMGKDDQGLASAKALDEALTKHHVRHVFRESDGAHTWRVWRNYLAEFLGQLFQKDS